MLKNEQELFIELCNLTNYKKSKIEKLLPSSATPAVLGELFFNRMQGVAYKVLKDCGLLSGVNREFRNALRDSYIQNIERNRSFFKAVEAVHCFLSSHREEYVMLKGALLCKKYPEGLRTSNDIDLLVRPRDVTKISNALVAAGFKQGHIRNEIFLPATRSEIIESKMMRGETIPFVMEINLPFMKFIEVDVNFSLDYKSGDDMIIDLMLRNAVCEEFEDFELITLSQEDFFIHLCEHLYKEATTLPWVEMKRDLTLYKFLDIQMYLNHFTEGSIERVFKRAAELDATDICACVVLWVNGIFNNLPNHITMCAKGNLKNSILTDMVYSPKEKKRYLYSEKNIRKRLFARDRVKLLEAM